MCRNSLFFFSEDLEIQDPDFHKRASGGACGSPSFLDRLRLRRVMKAAAAAVWGCPRKLHKRFYIRVILTSLNAAICTATDSN